MAYSGAAKGATSVFYKIHKPEVLAKIGEHYAIGQVEGYPPTLSHNNENAKNDAEGGVTIF